jgi:hypothetical protein
MNVNGGKGLWHGAKVMPKLCVICQSERD